MNTHQVEILQTGHGWHYAKCSCGWRSLGYAPQQRTVAEDAGSKHALAMLEEASA